MTKREIERTLLAVLRERGTATACPSDVARKLATTWRPLMPRVREVAAALQRRGVVDAYQRGRPVKIAEARGPIRLRLHEATWLFTINPRAPQAYDYHWDIDEPETLLGAEDKTWGTANYFRKMIVGDELAVYMKNTGAVTGDGIYVLGRVIDVDASNREFTWRPDRRRTKRLIHAPIPPEVVRELFGRGFGGPLRALKAGMERDWLQLVGR
ncbi:MAG TPA: DUF3253 domain-containing protein [Kofleriaceae bacterium]|nr:DUF3253 domain-containing protein [Kofleriaceae bacterium]